MSETLDPSPHVALRPVRRSTRVIVADDETLFRRGLAGMLSEVPGLDVAGDAALEELQALALALRPDVVVLGTPRLSAAARRLIPALAEIGAAVVILAADADPAAALTALKAGASGYELRSAPLAAVVAAIGVVARGDCVLSASLADSLLEPLSRPGREARPTGGLSERDADILRLVVAGHNYRQIGLRLSLSHRTVRKHISAMYRRLALSDRTQLTIYALKHGLVEPS